MSPVIAMNIFILAVLYLFIHLFVNQVIHLLMMHFATYGLLAPVDGHWNRWGSWGACSVSCNTGTQTRVRECTDPAPKNGGKACPESATGTQNCIMRSCSLGESSLASALLSLQHFLQDLPCKMPEI